MVESDKAKIESTHKIQVKVNGVQREASVKPRLLLVHFLRNILGLRATHIACDTSNCGACTVIVNGLAVRSCTVFAVQVNGKEVETLEGLGSDEKLHPVQEAFMEEHGMQCGFCTPGMMMTSVAFLRSNPDPTEEEIRVAISGNLCRCTGYMNIVKAVKKAAQKLKEEKPLESEQRIPIAARTD